MKKAQDFLVDSTLGDNPYKLKTEGEEKIVLSIEEGAVPAGLLKEVRGNLSRDARKNFVARFDEYLRSMGSPSSKDKATFFRLLAIMLNAGVPLIKSLDTISEQTPNHKLKRTISALARDIEKGGTLSGSMSNHPGIFSEEHLGMIRSGEASGQLNTILIQLAIEVEKAATLLRKVRGALLYPAFIVVLLIAVVSTMMVLVVPKIAEIFTESKQKLPLLTRVVIGTANFMKERWPLLLGAVVVLALAFTAFRRTRTGKVSTDWLLLHLPIVGKVVQKSILARFARSLGNLLSSGVPIIQGLLINAKGLGNEIYRKRVELASEDVSRGIPLGESLRDSPEFPNMMVQMISVGEQTASLDTISRKIAEYYEEEVDVIVGSLSSILEPVILVVVGVVVGGIVGAIILPLIQLTQLTGAL